MRIQRLGRACRTVRQAMVALATSALALAMGGCAGQIDEPRIEKSTSALSGPWIYYPLDSITSPGYAGYCGYLSGSTCGNYHDAYDLKGNVGDVVRAVSGGTIYTHGGCAEASSCTSDSDGLATCGGGCGNWAIIQHSNGMVTKYCHLNSISVGNGAAVAVGTQIGTVGHTGAANTCSSGFVSHLHFAVSTSLSGNGTYPNSGCTLYDRNANCVDPGVPAGESNSCTCATAPANLWVTSGSTVVLAKSQISGTATVNVQVYTGAGTVSVTRNGTAIGSTTSSQVFNFNIGDTYGFQATPASSYTFVNFCGDEPACSLNTTSNPMTGTITSASGYVYANFKANSPTCPTGSNWHLAGNYCWNEPGMSYTSAYHLYDCQSAGGSAGDLGNCGEGCHDEPVGVNDICYSAYCPTGGYWYGAGLYCGRASGMSNANPDIVYYCGGAGAKASINQWCSAACVVAPPGYNDHC